MCKAIITDRDMERLQYLVRLRDYYYGCHTEDIRRLGHLLEIARVVKSENIPTDLVTMNTKFEIAEMDSNIRYPIRIVYPENWECGHDRVSILTRRGTALLGRRVGDVIDIYRRASGLSYRVLIHGIIYQPEASGHYHL